MLTKLPRDGNRTAHSREWVWARRRAPRAGRRALLAAVVGVVALGGCLFRPCDETLVEAARTTYAAQQAAAPPLAGDAADAGLAALADWGALPTFRPSTYTQYSSQRRAPGRGLLDFGGGDFNNFVAVGPDARPLLIQSSDNAAAPASATGFVLAESAGPGYIARLFLTRISIRDLPSLRGIGQFEGEVLRVYLDDEYSPALTLPVADIGHVAPFQPPFASRDTAAIVSYVPLGFQRRVRVELEGLCPLALYYYHVAVQQAQGSANSWGTSAAYARAAALLDGTADPAAGAAEVVRDRRVTVAGGQTEVLHAATGPGTLRRLRFAWDSEADLGGLGLRVYYDGAAQAAIDCPLAAMLGLQAGFQAFSTVPLRVATAGNERVADFYLPMPFAQEVRLELHNETAVERSLALTVASTNELPAAPWGYLHAHWHALGRTPPAVLEHEVVALTGRGRYIGTWLYAGGRPDRGLGPLQHPLNLLEGNETGVIDGAVRLRGTGTEDYFNAGFYFRRGPFSQPFAAAPVVDTWDDDGRVACGRWHILSDAIDFQEAFELRLQYGDERPDLVAAYATLAFFYLDRPAR